MGGWVSNYMIACIRVLILYAPNRSFFGVGQYMFFKLGEKINCKDVLCPQ